MPIQLYTTREATRLGTDRLLRAEHAKGKLVRVRPGVYAAREEHATLSRDAQYRTLVRATSLVTPLQTQFCADSAAAMWRLPVLDQWSPKVHELMEPASGGRPRAGRQRHAAPFDPYAVELDGVLVTSLERTVVAVASAPHFARAVVMADAAFQTPVRHPLRREHYPDGLQLPAVRAVLESLLPFRGSARAERVLEFADGRAGSSLESQFRVQCLALGAPIPELQVAFHDEDGFIGITDGYWREYDAAVEIDGRAKYGARRHFQQDLTPEEILWREKKRGDRLNRVVRHFERLTKEDIVDRRRLERKLHRLGVLGRA